MAKRNNRGWRGTIGYPGQSQQQIRDAFLATAPAAPAPPAPQVQPFDASYWEQIALNQKALDQQLAQIEYSRGQVGQEYGFNAQGALDTSNPYNRATMLQRSYQQGQRGTTNSMAGRGQLYAGATQRNLDEGTFQYQRGYDTLRRGATDAYSRLTQAEQEARHGLSQSSLDAQREALQRADEARLSVPAPPSVPSAPQAPRYARPTSSGSWRGTVGYAGQTDEQIRRAFLNAPKKKKRK